MNLHFLTDVEINGVSFNEAVIWFYGNRLAIWHGFLDITHIKVNNGRTLAILN